MFANDLTFMILKFTAIFSTLNYCHATVNYGGYDSSGGSYSGGIGQSGVGYGGGGYSGFYGGALRSGFVGSLGGSYSGGFASNIGSYGGVGGVIPAAVISRHSVDIRNVGSQYAPIAPQIIEVDAGIIPLTIHFKSASSKINVIQSHQGSGGSEESTYSEDAPHRLYHSVTKPIIQEVREIITPYRRVIQEIQPVQEDVQTIVARGEPRYGGAGIGGAVAYGGGVGVGVGGSAGLGISSGFKGFGGGYAPGGYGGGGGGGGYVGGYAIGRRAGDYAGVKAKY